MEVCVAVVYNAIVNKQSYAKQAGAAGWEGSAGEGGGNRRRNIKGHRHRAFLKSSSEDAVRESEAKREMRMLLLLEKEQGEVSIERLCCVVVCCAQGLSRALNLSSSNMTKDVQAGLGQAPVGCGQNGGDWPGTNV